MKLLLVGNFLSATRGTRFYCEDLAVRLASRGHTVLTTSAKDGRVARLTDMLLTMVRRRRSYDLAVVDCYSGASFRWAELATQLALRLGKPCLLVLHGGRLPEFRTSCPARVERLLKLATLVATPSRYLQQAFSDLRKDIAYLPNGLDLSRYTWRFRRDVSPHLVWLRAFHESYQPHMAIRALAELVKTFPDAWLEMIGPDKGDGSLSASKQLAKQLGVADRVVFSGAILKTEVPARLQAGDIYLNTTRYESFGVAVLEAAACGLPIVSTAVGEIPYLWNDGREMLLVPHNRPEEMACAVQHLLAEPDLVASLSRNARAKAEQFDWGNVLFKWEELFQNIMEGIDGVA